MSKINVAQKKSFIKRLQKDLRHNWILYLMMLLPLAYFIIFHYWPMYGVSMAFKDYKVKLGIAGSRGLE